MLVVHGGISDTTDLDLIRSLDRGKYVSLLRPPGTECIDKVEWKQVSGPWGRVCVTKSHYRSNGALILRSIILFDNVTKNGETMTARVKEGNENFELNLIN